VQFARQALSLVRRRAVKYKEWMAIGDPEWLIQQLLLLPPLLLSLVIHEYAHARTALAFGDTTARDQGRLTLNPMAHLDPVGTLCLILAHFGWARPVPVNPHRLHPPRIADIMVSLAGPASNLAIAVICGVALRVLYWQIGVPQTESVLGLVYQMLMLTMIVNVALCVFNLIPLFPLDGHHIVREQLSPLGKQSFMEWQGRYGQFVLMALIVGPRFLEVANPKLLQNMPWLDPIGLMFRFARARADDLLHAGL
jgi:Zn-dependent protease